MADIIFYTICGTILAVLFCIAYAFHKMEKYRSQPWSTPKPREPRRPLTEQEKQTRALQSIEREVRRGRIFGRKVNEWTWWTYWGKSKNK